MNKKNKKLKTAILIDTSIRFYNDDFKKFKGVFTIPFNIIKNNGAESILDDNKTVNANKILEELQQKHNYKTSQPSSEQFKNAFNQILKQDYDQIVVFTVYNKISSTYDCAANVVVQNENFHGKVLVLHAKGVLYQAYLQFLYLYKLISKNKSLKEINEENKKYEINNEFFGIAKNFKKAKSSGRFKGPIAHLIFNSLKLKLFVTAKFKEHKFHVSMLKLTRTYAKGIEKILHKIKDKDNLTDVIINYGTISDDELKEIAQKLNSTERKFKIYSAQFPTIYTAILGDQISLDFVSKIKEKPFFLKEIK